MCNRELLNLLSEYQNRDMRHFELLYEVFYKLILSYSKRVGEKESQQDLSDFLVELLFKIDVSKFAADDSETLKRYIAVCLRNEYYAMLKDKQKRIAAVCELDENLCTYTPDFEEKIFFEQFLNSVSDKQRRILIMRYVYNFSDLQIAQELHISRQAVNKTRKKALKNLRDFFEF